MIDSFTAKTLLEAGVRAEGTDVVANLYNEMKNNPEGGPSTEARDFFVKNQGKKCIVRHTSHEGIVYRLNEATMGFYPGARYPIKVQITNGEAKGAIFEYDLDQVEVTE